MEDLSWKTAISRKKLSGPMKYLNDAGFLSGHVLDYGCGRGSDADKLGFHKYDPHFFPGFVTVIGGFDNITCIYVLNVKENSQERNDIERSIMTFLKPGGTSFIAVRNDKRLLKGTTSKKTWQGFVKPSKKWQLIKTTPQFRLYCWTKPIVDDNVNILDLFSKDDAKYITLHAAGHQYEMLDANLYNNNLEDVREKAKTDPRTKMWLMDHGTSQEIVIKVVRKNNPDKKWDYFELIIDSDGGVKLGNLGECTLPLKNPLLVYERVLRKFRPEIFKN